MIIFLSWCSCNIVSPVLPRLSSYGTQACDLYTWDGPNSGIPSVKRSVWSGCIFQNWYYFNQCVYIRNSQILLSHYPQTIPKPTIISTILKTEKDHLVFVILLIIMDLTHTSYTSTIAKTATTLSWSHTQVAHYDVISLSLSLSLFCCCFMTPFLSCFFCWVWRSLKYMYMVFTFPNSKLLFNEVIRNRPWFQHFTSVQTNVGIWFVDPMHVNWTTLTVEEKQSLIPNKTSKWGKASLNQSSQASSHGFQVERADEHCESEIVKLHVLRMAEQDTVAMQTWRDKLYLFSVGSWVLCSTPTSSHTQKLP